MMDRDRKHSPRMWVFQCVNVTATSFRELKILLESLKRTVLQNEVEVEVVKT